MSGSVLIIAGMHRSGTSYVASALLDAGLCLGERLMPAVSGNNIKGFYENLEFVELHKKILRFHGLSTDGWTLERGIPVPDALRVEAERVVEKNTQPGHWGWKDPRATLFLDFWSETLPEAKFLFVCRAPWEVIDSLFRRGDEEFQNDPRLAVRMWEHYNSIVLDFRSRYPDRCLLVDVDTVAQEPSLLFDAIGKQLSMPLTRPARNSFDESLLKRAAQNSFRPLLIRNFFPSAYQQWLELKGASSLRNGLDLSVDSISDNVLESLIEQSLHDWMEAGKAQREMAQAVKQAQQELACAEKRWHEAWYEVRSQLYEANAKIEYMERSRLWKIRDKLYAVRKVLSP